MSGEEPTKVPTSSDRRAYELARAAFDAVAAPDLPPFDPDPELVTHLDHRQPLPELGQHNVGAGSEEAGAVPEQPIR